MVNSQWVEEGALQIKQPKWVAACFVLDIIYCPWRCRQSRSCWSAVIITASPVLAEPGSPHTGHNGSPIQLLLLLICILSLPINIFGHYYVCRVVGLRFQLRLRVDKKYFKNGLSASALHRTMALYGLHGLVMYQVFLYPNGCFRSILLCWFQEEEGTVIADITAWRCGQAEQRAATSCLLR